MLDLVPLARTGREVTHRDREARARGQIRPPTAGDGLLRVVERRLLGELIALQDRLSRGYGDEQATRRD
jgi:hypothetical protein